LANPEISEPKNRQLLQKIKNYRRKRRLKTAFKSNLRPTDVFLIGHPKSGNTWLALMLSVLIEKNFNKKVNLSNIQDFIPAMHARDKSIELYDNFPDPRIFRNEGPVYPKLYPKTIYIMRDPRAVYVSYYHHYIHDTNDVNRSLEDFVMEMLTHGCIRNLEPHIQRWDKQIMYWLSRAKKQRVMFVKYEDMIQDRYKVLKKTVDFIGMNFSEKEIETAVQRGSFDGMRQEELTYGAEPYSGDKGEKGFYVRRGKINGWRDELSPDVAKSIKTQFAEAMKEGGYI